MKKNDFKKLIQSLGLLGAGTFFIVGLIFLFFPSQVLILFNNLSLILGLPVMPIQAASFYLALAVGYMYLVTLLAYLIYKHPFNKYFSLLLAHAKLGSSVLSLWLIFKDQFYLIYLTNGIVDGILGLGAALIYFKVKD